MAGGCRTDAACAPPLCQPIQCHTQLTKLLGPACWQVLCDWAAVRAKIPGCAAEPVQRILASWRAS